MTHSSKYSLSVFLFFGFIALTMLAPIASNTYIPNIGDFWNHLTTIVQAKIALDAGQFPLRIAPLEHFGWGYPLFQFYGSTAYTVAALIFKYITPWNAFIAYKITLWFCITLGGIYMHCIARWLTGSQAIGLLAGAFYLLSPHYLTIINSWGGLTEPMTLGFTAMALYYTLRCCLTEDGLPSFLFAALAWYLIVTTHPISFVYTTLFIGILVLVLKCLKMCSWEKCLWATSAYGFGCLLAMWVLAPIVFLGSSLEISSTIKNPSNYSTLSPLPALLTPKLVSPHLGLITTHVTINPAFGWPALMTVMMCIYLLFSGKISRDHVCGRLMTPLLILFTITFFIAWSPIDFWSYFPKLFSIGQYCWRMLSQSMWILTLLLMCALYWFSKENTLDGRHVVVGVLLLGIAVSSWVPVLTRYPYKIEEIVKHPLLGFSKYDYTLASKHIPATLDETQMVAFTDHEKNMNTHMIIEVPTLLLNSYPSLVVRVEGNVPSVNANSHARLQLFSNQHVIATRSLQKGHLLWDIPISKLYHPKEKTFYLQFKLTGLKALPLQRPVVFTHFNPLLNVMSVEKSEHFCQRSQDRLSTHCEIKVPPHINFLQLPVMYYPELLDVTLNGEKVEFTATLYKWLGLTGLKPISGKLNQIDIRFTGFPWANQLSLFSWILWSVSVLFLFGLKIFHRFSLKPSPVPQHD